ncbi:hypothetical protein MKW92_020176 [Papaver armeniacum]|nr:hypothetical protein MKW92_020176 [Papaver armeniacum]
MDGLESICSFVKRDTDDSPDRKGDMAGDEDKRKHWLRKSQKHTSEEDASE